ncbi:MAG: chromate transporter, partial [Pseudomonadota bacterium]
FAHGTRGPADEMIGSRDSQERPDHARPSMARFARSLAICLVLWLAPVVVLLAVVGPASVYTEISLLFSKVAVMAIGGDYAVVAYAAHEVVDAHHWITAHEMQEGIALGEMVPGTIMIVTQFLGFMAAYRDPGLLPPLLGAVLGGVLATWATFAPCFLLIFVVAPYIEGLRKNAFLDGPLRAVTAAAVGMIANLSVWFGIRALFGQVVPLHYGWFAVDMPNFATFDPRAMGLFVLAAVAMFRLRTSAAATLCACSAIGILLFYFGIAGVH